MSSNIQESNICTQKRCPGLKSHTLPQYHHALEFVYINFLLKKKKNNYNSILNMNEGDIKKYTF